MCIILYRYLVLTWECKIILMVLRKCTNVALRHFFSLMSSIPKCIWLGFTTSGSLTVQSFLLCALWEAVCVIMSVKSLLKKAEWVRLVFYFNNNLHPLWTSGTDSHTGVMALEWIPQLLLFPAFSWRWWNVCLFVFCLASI